MQNAVRKRRRRLVTIDASDWIVSSALYRLNLTNVTVNKTDFTSYLLNGQIIFLRAFFDRLYIVHESTYRLFLHVLKMTFFFCCVTENLAPSELKKLRNKQRKQRRKAELERQQAAQAQEKREQHNKSRQQNDPDLEQPTLDELIPEKLERVSIKVR